MGFSQSKIKLFWRTLKIVQAVLLMFMTASCAERYLKTEGTTAGEATGNYRLLLFGCKYPDDIENVAFLDKEGDPYTMEIYAPDFQYRIVNNVPADKAFADADQFIRCNVHYQQTQLRKVLDPQGNVAGYEVRPLYAPVRYGMLDVMIISYAVKGNRIIVYVRLDPRVQAEIENQGDQRDRGNR